MLWVLSRFFFCWILQIANSRGGGWWMPLFFDSHIAEDYTSTIKLLSLFSFVLRCHAEAETTTDTTRFKPQTSRGSMKLNIKTQYHHGRLDVPSTVSGSKNYGAAILQSRGGNVRNLDLWYPFALFTLRPRRPWLPEHEGNNPLGGNF